MPAGIPFTGKNTNLSKIPQDSLTTWWFFVHGGLSGGAIIHGFVFCPWGFSLLSFIRVLSGGALEICKGNSIAMMLMAHEF